MKGSGINAPALFTPRESRCFHACDLLYRHMFGGTTLYSKGKVVALICDSQLFVMPTEAGRAYIGNVTEAPACEGSKNFFLVDDDVDDT